MNETIISVKEETNPHEISNLSYNEAERNILINHLLDNAKGAVIGAIELHNKPIFPRRYEVSIVLTINAWELAFKAFIVKYHKDVKVFEGNWFKEFDKCLGFISSELGNDFLVQKESINKLYEYRCSIIHFYGEKIETILYSLLRPNIIFFSDFLLKHFEIDLGADTNLIILPLGFKRFVSPIDFLSKQQTEGSESIKNFIKSIQQSATHLSEHGIEDGLLLNYSMAVENVNRVKHADIVVGITKDESDSRLSVNKIIKLGGFTTDTTAPLVQIEETSLYTEKFIYTNDKMVQKIKKELVDIKLNPRYNAIIKTVKENVNFFKWRYLDTSPNPKGTKQGYYSEEGIKEIIKLWQEGK